MKTARLIVFPGGFNWPLWVAQEKGWFAANGVDVQLTPTPGSVFQLSGLIEGRFDIAITLIDNIVAYREGQGEVPIVGPDLFAFMAADPRMFPTLVTQPDVRRYADLRGRTLSVDAKTTGLVIVLRAMLEQGGLAPGDYELESVGGVSQRFDAMLAGCHAGTLFNSPFEALLQTRGFNCLDSARTVLGQYQGHVAAARRSWAREHRDVLVSFTRAYLQAVNWLYDPAHRDEAFAVFDRNQPNAGTGGAASAHRILFDRETGFPRDGAIDMAGVAKVIELRERYGTPRKALGEPADYCETSVLAEARGETA